MRITFVDFILVPLFCFVVPFARVAMDLYVFCMWVYHSPFVLPFSLHISRFSSVIRCSINCFTLRYAMHKQHRGWLFLSANPKVRYVSNIHLLAFAFALWALFSVSRYVFLPSSECTFSSRVYWIIFELTKKESMNGLGKRWNTYIILWIVPIYLK